MIIIITIKQEYRLLNSKHLSKVSGNPRMYLSETANNL